MRPVLPLVALVLLSTSALGAERTRVLVLDLKTTAVDKDTAALVADLMTVNLSQYPELEVFAGADVRRMAELEADKAASGCEDDSSCLADIAGALGARYVIYGRLGKLGTRFICTLNLYDADEGKAVKREDIKAQDLDELGDRLDRTLVDLVAPIVGSEKVAVQRGTAVSDEVVVEEKRDPDIREPLAPRPDRGFASALYMAGGISAGSAYACAATTGLVGIGSGDPSMSLSVIPLIGPALSATGFGSGGGEGVCYTCAGVQTVGLCLVLAGWLIDPGEGDVPKRVELASTTRLAELGSAMPY